ncbi:HEPN domain-containing protein [Leadbettera azotonutricia]|uniref:Hepn domain protein n=1 Tax=Leadbettera azotonutricia (strain ATCC BAA-888 / DSM 13862 / ZAS-9) TaxID=545695 RepID=F5YCY4_LEAAZ|nr:HEPN domain-containing protein [Leadbettera azotonutricia]AEF80492.1 hepn domain protein [Leadbettera azotonutricia ZAS-9]
MADIKLVKEWFQYASNDLIIAQHAINDVYPKLLEIACYHCQQSAEKSLKGYLFFKDIEPPKKHDLRLLNSLCLELDKAFEVIRPYCADLTGYGVLTRYPNELDVDEAITKSVLDKAKQVYDFCLMKVSIVEIEMAEKENE